MLIIFVYQCIIIDVAISIPFINHGSSNIIHIYRGSKDGLSQTPSQVSATHINFY